MALFQVTEILSGNKVRVAKGWSWGEHKGTDVVIAGYDPTKGSDGVIKNLNEQLATIRLTSLINGKDIELGQVISVNGECITCIVYYNGVDIAKYFPEYPQTLRG